ncbi:phosphotransferase [Candidatus Poribacteria bacterium]|jgi:Ser/Thr protein kinase RdoA (MazF antagonist)|nr:phosphotransferase [Candidatus Poribacteria bacterium]MBT5710629.1 phosphotransferase [Candidatus Poribacteria bacterium]MBT7098764.1 phosphotransferase [Candidatus Poribacteria bacterium]MBT7807120.1 phosphotransferase [Candidatus Poribacteria bacterium]
MRDLLPDIIRAYAPGDLSDIRWRYASDATIRLGSMRARGSRLLFRAYAGPEGPTKAIYHTEFIARLAEAGIPTEQLLPTTTGSLIASAGDMALVASTALDEPRLRLDRDACHRWGSLAARMHEACVGWRPSARVTAPMLRGGLRAAVQRAIRCATPVPACRAFLEGRAQEIADTCACALASGVDMPVHGDLWPGNILVSSDGLRPVDFVESGDGSPIIDFATAFRWTTVEAPEPQWDAWIAGYEDVRPSLRGTELAALPAVASLQQMYWMCAEVEEVAAIGEEEAAPYIEDHCSTIRGWMEDPPRLA